MSLSDAQAALLAGRLADARSLMTALCATKPSVEGWLLLSDVEARAGDGPAQLRALDAAQALNGQDVRVLLAKGDYYDTARNPRQAGAFYAQALAIAQQNPAHARPMVAALQRAQTKCNAYAKAYEAHLNQALAAPDSTNAPGTEDQSARFTHSLDIMFGRKPVFAQQPTQYYFPGLPAQPFYDTALFDWCSALEAATPSIRDELNAYLKTADAFAPYVSRNTDGPRSDHSGMMDNAGWSALFLWRDGKPDHALQHRFPATTAIMETVTKADIPGHSPTVLFSLLKAGTKIPPHTGLINTRLIGHLPLIVPDGCALRVGAQTRPWTLGSAMIFDDTIEHEAWNTSQADRYVLIFDTPNPLLTPMEHQKVRRLFGAIESFAG
ncbi:MAG: aspartyl/asparaginyl beta-hydroxylase domain-containing protein [Pseudomonadota bacterium]